MGRLRGEVTIANTVMHQLSQLGFQTRHTIVRYTSDEWKGKPEQLAQFSNPEKARSYIGRRLIDVPDPQDNLASWVDRYWEDFGEYLNHFSRDAELFSTHDIYKLPAMQELVKYATENREKVRSIINKYRARNPYPKDWFPIHVVCDHCQRISTTTVESVDLDAYTANYRCDGCSIKGTTNIGRGKLSWRIEWAALWRILEVGFESFGKDHASPGGSRDSAKEIAETFFNFKPPVPFPYEWVGFIEGGVDKGDMGSSNFHGFTPKTWVSVAPGNVLRYLFLKNKPMKRITLGLDYIPNYIGQYERAERVYYGIDTPKAPPLEIADIRRSYELANLDPVPQKVPLQVPYLHAVLLSQVIPQDKLPDSAIEKLIQGGIISASLTKSQQAYITKRLNRAKIWVENYAPASYRIITLTTPPKGLNQSLSAELRVLYQQLHDALNPNRWTEQDIIDVMKKITQPLSNDIQRAFFRYLYKAFFGTDKGPRIAAYFAFTDPVVIRARLQYLGASAK